MGKLSQTKEVLITLLALAGVLLFVTSSMMIGMSGLAAMLTTVDDYDHALQQTTTGQLEATPH